MANLFHHVHMPTSNTLFVLHGHIPLTELMRPQIPADLLTVNHRLGLSLVSCLAVGWRGDSGRQCRTHTSSPTPKSRPPPSRFPSPDRRSMRLIARQK
jgi:hypothetical protein